MASFVENPNKLELIGEYKKAVNSQQDFSDLKNVIFSKKEIRIRDSIRKVLLALDHYQKLNTSGIIDKARIHNNTFYRVIRFLLNRKIVTEKRIRHINNQKFYLLQRNRAIVYLRFLYLSELNKFFKNLEKNILRHPEKYGVPYRSLHKKIQKEINGFVKETFSLSDDIMKDCGIQEHTVCISKLVLEKADPLIMFFISRKLCMGKCFEDRHLEKIMVKNGVNYCKKCGYSKSLEVQYNYYKPLKISRPHFEKNSIPP